jgi:hypothetical protein
VSSSSQTEAARRRLVVKCDTAIPHLLSRGPATSYNLAQLVGSERQVWALVTQQAVREWLLNHPELVQLDADQRWRWTGPPVPKPEVWVIETPARKTVMDRLPTRAQMRSEINAKGQAIVAATYRVSLATLRRYLRQAVA